MIYFVTALEDRSWWGLAGRQYLLALISTGVDVRFLPFTNGVDPTNIEPEFAPITERFGGSGAEPEASIVHGDLDALASRALYSPELMGPRDIALTTWHEARIPDEFVQGLRSYKEVWVPTNSAKHVLNSYGVENVEVVWTPVNDQEWRRTQSARPNDRFVFYGIGSWSADRLDAITLAYITEFEHSEPVLLYPRFLD